MLAVDGFGELREVVLLDNVDDRRYGNSRVLDGEQASLRVPPTIKHMWKLAPTIQQAGHDPDGLAGRLVGHIKDRAAPYPFVLPDGYDGARGHFLWCTGLAPDNFREDSPVPEAASWASGENFAGCVDLHIWVDAVAQDIAIDFEGIRLLDHAVVQRRVREKLPLAVEFDDSVKEIGNLADALFADMLKS